MFTVHTCLWKFGLWVSEHLCVFTFDFRLFGPVCAKCMLKYEMGNWRLDIICLNRCNYHIQEIAQIGFSSKNQNVKNISFWNNFLSCLPVWLPCRYKLSLWEGRNPIFVSNSRISLIYLSYLCNLSLVQYIYIQSWWLGTHVLIESF